eukprot:4489920-Pleurochrysis_carterae.AAC.3
MAEDAASPDTIDESDESDGFLSTPRVDLSLLALALRLLPIVEHYALVYEFAHARSVELASGLVAHAFAAALRACLNEHLIGLAQLQQQHRTSGLGLQQMW